MFIFEQHSPEEVGTAFKELLQRLNENKIKTDDIEEREIENEEN